MPFTSKGHANYIDQLHDDIDYHRWFSSVFNFLGLIIAFVSFCLCIWIRFDLDFWEWCIEIEWYSYWNIVYVVLVSNVLSISNHALGFRGIFYESNGNLLFHTIAHGLLAPLQLGCAIAIIIYGVEESATLTQELNGVFLNLVHKWDVDPRSSRILKQIQEYVGCCGADGSDDFINAHKPVPYECRHPVSGVEYTYGCQQQFAWWLEPWTATIASILLYQILSGILTMWTTSKLRKNLKKYNEIY